MPRIFTLGALVGRAQKRCDMEGQSFITDPEWKEILSTGYAELYSILVASGMRYYESEATISSNGGASYALPPDHLATIGVDQLIGQQRRPLEELMVQERPLVAGISVAEARAFSLVGANLVLYPTPPSGQTYLHAYAPQPADLSSAIDATNVDVVTPDGENFLVWHAAVIALAKEESDTSVAMAERERARARVEEWATLRSLNTPRRRIVHSGPHFDGYGPADAADWIR